ncbi:MAG TPA: GtrA family protein [Bacteroidales bacterium]|nr:GtrA family protein [Bacteroidales bacterium]
MKNKLQKLFTDCLNRFNLLPFYTRHKTKIKFLLVGAWNTIFGFVVFIALYKVFVNIFKVDYFAYTTAQVLSNILAIINAYVCHKYITFQSKARGKKMIMEFLRFSSTYITVFLLGLILMPFFVEILKINPIVSSIILNVIVVLSSYLAHSRFSFKNGRNNY